MTPKVFISYNWTSEEYQNGIRQLAERLMADAVDVVFDVFDFKEGNDKYVFMERMVTDSTVTHVLMFCDQKYAEKADARRAGVGTESQIISREVYEKVNQEKFIPIICEKDAEGKAYLPAFLKTRKWIDFSTPEATNQNWEQLVRFLHGKPLHVKPQLGPRPAYLEESASPASPVIGKLSVLKGAIARSVPNVRPYRQDFLEACHQQADELRLRQQPESLDPKVFAEQILLTYSKLKPLRDAITDWVLAEGSSPTSQTFVDSLTEFMERLLDLKSRPKELNPFNERWMEAHEVFVYETFLYIVAALMKAEAYTVLHEVFTTNYLQPREGRYGEQFDNFSTFWGRSELLHPVLDPPGQKLHSPAAELIHRHADRRDLPFASVLEAELLCLMMSGLNPNAPLWFPQMWHYGSHASGRFFLRATQHKGFQKLAIITGIPDADELRKRIAERHKAMGSGGWFNFWLHDRNFASAMHLDKLDSIP
jgi:hypothetical protein